jgi:periplasmic protein TonB
MLNVLLESRAPRTRRVGGTVASALVHAGLLAGAIALTVPKPVRANDGPKEVIPPIYIPIDHSPEMPTPRQARPRQPEQGPVAPSPGPVLTFSPDIKPIAEIDPAVGPATPVEEFGTGLPTGGPIGQPTGPVGPAGGVIEERYVDRSPRLIGRVEQPAFPAALRMTGRSGKVVAQFVIDTLGRAEMGDLRMVEATDPLFAESVRAVLPRYRFSPGEAGGRKVRTLVQLPFDFTLTR